MSNNNNNNHKQNQKANHKLGKIFPIYIIGKDLKKL